MANQQFTKTYYRALPKSQKSHWLVVSLLLGVMAGCGWPTSQLPTGMMPTVDADSADVSSVSQLNPADAPACARIGEPRTSTHLAMFEELNRYRVENGLEPLLYSKTLEAAADEHVEDLWVRGYFSHTNPDGEDPGDRAMRAGFCHHYVGENIAAGQTSTQHALQAWIDSPPHNANMLEPKYVYVGMGYSVDTYGRKYWGQSFAYDLP